MNENIKNEEIFDSICDGVRFAISVGDELTEEQKKHLDECDECRTFFEQSKIMSEELAAMGSISLTKNGKSLADSVMEEIAKQELFTKGPAKKSKFAFFTKHAGLIAAGIALVIMALPLMQNMLNSKKKDYITSPGTGGNESENNAVLLSAADEPSDTVEKPKRYTAFMSPAENNTATAPAPEADYDADFEEPEADAEEAVPECEVEEASEESQDYNDSGDYNENKAISSNSKSENGSAVDKNDVQSDDAVCDDAFFDGSAYVTEDITADSVSQEAKPSYMMPPQNSTGFTSLGGGDGTSEKEMLATEAVKAYLEDTGIDYSHMTITVYIEHGTETQYTFSVVKSEGEYLKVTVLTDEENGVFVVKDVFEG